MVEQICPGFCNVPYRRAHAAYDAAVERWERAEQIRIEKLREGDDPGKPAAKPEPPTIRARAGDPIWCTPCAATISRCLGELDDLMSLRVTMADGYQVPGDPLSQRVSKTSEDPSPSPGHDDLDELTEWLRVWEIRYRETQNSGTVPYRGVNAPALTSALAWLSGRLSHMLAHPEIAADFGRGVLWWHARLEAVTRTRPPMRHKPLPCPRCQHRSLFLHDDETIRCNCRNETCDCGRILTPKQYAELEAEADQQTSGGRDR